VVVEVFVRVATQNDNKLWFGTFKRCLHFFFELKRNRKLEIDGAFRRHSICSCVLISPPIYTVLLLDFPSAKMSLHCGWGDLVDVGAGTHVGRDVVASVVVSSLVAVNIAETRSVSMGKSCSVGARCGVAAAV